MSAGSSPTTTSMDQSLLKSGISLSWTLCTCFFSPECSALQLCCSTWLWTSEHSFSTLSFEVSACVDHVWNNILHHIMFVHQIVCRDLNSNKLDGSIPSEIGNLVKLTYLYVLLLSRMQCFHICDVPLDCGQVNTRFPPSYLKCLHVLMMSGMHHIMFVHQIVCRFLSSNNLDGSIPPEIGNLTELTQMYVVFCGYSFIDFASLPFHGFLSEWEIVCLGIWTQIISLVRFLPSLCLSLTWVSRKWHALHIITTHI